MITWKAILLIYSRINVELPGNWWRKKTFAYQLTPHEIQDALDSFSNFPALARDCSVGEVDVATEIYHVERSLDSLTSMGAGNLWPSPSDTKAELNQLIVPNSYDSVFVYWPQNNPVTGESVPSGGWGLGMGASEWSNFATYATIANAPTALWQRPVVGEVWLHEWLHGVCHHFAEQGYQMPDGDADGGGRHGYIQSDTSGWTDFYRDLMTGKVNSGNQETGIPSAAWQSGSILTK